MADKRLIFNKQQTPPPIYFANRTSNYSVVEQRLSRHGASSNLLDRADAIAGEVDAEALELGGVVVLVLEDEVEVVVTVALHGLDGAVVTEGTHHGCGVVHLLDEVGDIQADDVVDAAEGIFRIGL